MKLSSLLIFLLIVGSTMLKAESENEIRSPQPGGKAVVVFSRESDRSDYWISILAPDGTKLLNEAVDLSVSPIMWNKDGTMGAFSGGTFRLMDCYVVLLQASNYKLIKLRGPELGWDNYHSTPLKWSNNVLYLDIDGPHAGKANGYHFSGHMKVLVKGPTETPKVIEEKIDVDKDAE